MLLKPVSRFAFPGSTVFFSVGVDPGSSIVARACDEAGGFDIGVTPSRGDEDGAFRLRIDIPKHAGMA